MAKAEELKNGEIQHISLQMSNFPINILQKIIPGNQFSLEFEEPTSETEEIELTLGLSLNGRFGVDPERAKMIKRSSSIPDFINSVKIEDSERVASTAWTPLIRTCSLPAEAEEEWRRKKELQSLRRMEAKRKRSEKQRNLKISRVRNRSFGEENCEEERKVGLERRPPPPRPQSEASPGSNGSRGSGSSGISEFESQPVQGVNKCTDARSPASIQSMPESEQKPAITPGAAITDKSAGVVKENPSNNFIADKAAKEMVRNVLEDMPCVSAKGDGPNGKRIEGFLYRYRKGEEVRIVCVCHGSFLSPAEFVKHAGGGDVAYPLKHILVNPSPFL